jgi:hypothetical protein
MGALTVTLPNVRYATASLQFFAYGRVIDARCAWESGACPRKILKSTVSESHFLRFERRFDEIFRSINCKCIEE